jgi:hypothetical protein
VEHGGRTDIAWVREREHALRQLKWNGQDHLVDVDRQAELQHDLGEMVAACKARVWPRFGKQWCRPACRVRGKHTMCLSALDTRRKSMHGITTVHTNTRDCDLRR